MKNIPSHCSPLYECWRHNMLREMNIIINERQEFIRDRNLVGGKWVKSKKLGVRR